MADPSIISPYQSMWAIKEALSAKFNIFAKKVRDAFTDRPTEFPIPDNLNREWNAPNPTLFVTGPTYTHEGETAKISLRIDNLQKRGWTTEIGLLEGHPDPSSAAPENFLITVHEYPGLDFDDFYKFLGTRSNMKRFVDESVEDGDSPSLQILIRNDQDETAAVETLQHITDTFFKKVLDLTTHPGSNTSYGALYKYTV